MPVSYDTIDMPDPRRPIERIRRAQLREICLKHGIPLPSPMPPATLMRSLIEAEGGVEAVLRKPVQPVREMTQEAPLNESSRALVHDALQAMPMPKLRQECSKRGIVFNPRDKKATLVERILDNGSS